jgi:iron(III) transport system ATP-binding protein
MPQDKLELRAVSKVYGAFTAVDSVSFGLKSGHMLALLGPSGCGKTTTLRMIAGLERPTSGVIVLDGQVLANASHSVPPERRGLGMVFQTYALWPHMTVFENVAYGLRRLRLPQAELTVRVSEVLATIGMAGYENRPATNLSGGQQQRVAVARALATRPKILLFDEPLSNLDALLREAMRFEIRSLQQEHGITAVYVTHSQDEALAIADTIAIMKDGRMQQMGNPEQLYSQPRNRFVAGFVGLANVLSGSSDGAAAGELGVVLQNGVRCRCVFEAGHSRPAPGEVVSLAIRPENIQIAKRSNVSPDAGDGEAMRLAGTVKAAVFTGNLIDYFVHIDGLPDQIRVQSLPPAVAAQGEAVTISIQPKCCVLLED